MKCIRYCVLLFVFGVLPALAQSNPAQENSFPEKVRPQLSANTAGLVLSDNEKLRLSTPPVLRVGMADAIPKEESEELFNRWMGARVEQGIKAGTLVKYGAALVLLFLLFGYWVYRMRREIGFRKGAEMREHSRSDILEMLAKETPLPEVLETIVRSVEHEKAGTICSILLLDSAGKHLGKTVAPGLPAFYNAALDGIEIGPGVGSCGTAAFTGERVIVDDIAIHPYWASYKELAARAGLGACWSQPIRSSTGKIFGTFAIYHRKAHTPTESDFSIIEQSARLASIAIEKSIAAEKLRDSEALYRLLTEGVSDVIWKADKNLFITYISPADERIRGYQAEEVIGHHVFEMFTAEGVATVKEVMRKRKETEQQGTQIGSITFEVHHRCKDGRLLWAEVSSEPERDANGTITGYHGITREMTERKRIAEELMLAKQAADNASRAKSDFLANMSHEIRTPMNAIIGMTHLCLKTELGDKQRDYIEKAYHSARMLLGIINDLLDFSKIEANKLALESNDFNLHSTLANLDSMVGHLAREKGLRFEIFIHDDVPDFLLGDELRLAQVLMNLSGNAVKFTSSGAVSISVNLKSAEEKMVELEFSVKDTGIGLTHEQAQCLFHPFTQADTSTTRQYGGTGLGLAISKRLVEMMAGSIRVESEPEVGSTFSFTARFGLGKAFVESIPTSSEEQISARARLNGANILLAEDNPFNQQVAAELMEEFGVNVTSVNNGREALAMLDKEHFDIVLMDVQMPEMDGYEATRQIRANPLLAEQKVIAMSASAMAEDRERCLASGMNDFIGKPIDPELMMPVLAKWMPPRSGISLEEGADLRSSKERRSGGDRRAAGARKQDDVIDLAVLSHLVSDDPARVRKFAYKFLETAQKTLLEMDAAYSGGDLAALGGLGHKLKSSARTVGAMGFAEICQTLESAGNTIDSSQAEILLEQLHSLLERIARQVEQETA